MRHKPATNQASTALVRPASLWVWGLPLLGVILWALPARAQTPSPLAEWQYSSGIQLQHLFEPSVPTWQVELGLGSQFAPVADGLNRYQVQPGPVIDVRYKDEFFFSTGEGLGVNLLSFRHIDMGAAITYDLGRSAHADGKALEGLGTIHPAPEVKFFATYALAEAFPLTLRLDVRRQIGATNGWVGDFGAYLPMPGSSAKFAWFAGPTVTAGDGRYMQGYFGVSQTQSYSTNYRQYKAAPGLKSAGFGVSAAWFLTPHWVIDMSAAYERLLGSAANSPITESKNEGVVSLSGLYKF
ncbi:MAG TPA: MipA/OmpV family protein [Acidocella sp.]|jgi:outer membrane scaffolding protein for murein synthesis (MipA/OmpV family)|nr:MipA/OmpV family protein [Acidocella sp.]OYV50456.1 MAG: MltA-interacting MipA family protein [Acidocella sp. 20-58-15]OYY04241.1 MAG: MltA-interacting MipA family protein [Acidocella sp. 35-58-6]HQT39552.1 MipA/OmpV family protein [Acidocella sp.]